MKLAHPSLLTLFSIPFLLLAACGGGGDGPTDPDNGDPPSLNPFAVDLLLEEDQGQTADLSGIVTNGTLQGVTVVEGSNIVSVSLEGSTLHITPAPDQHGSFRLEFTASNSDGTTSRQRSGSVQPWTDIPAGQLQDNETDTGAPGAIRLYDAADSSLIETISTDADGNYEGVQNVTDGDLIVQAALTDESELVSYVRTLRTLDGEDFDGEIIRVVPFTGLEQEGITVEDFRSHVLDLRRHDNHEITKWDSENFEGVYIIETNPEADDNSQFAQTEQENIKDIWTSPNGAPRLIEGHVPDTVIIGTDQDESPPYTLGEGRGSISGEVIPNQGWVVIKPDSTMPAAGYGAGFDIDNDGKYDTGLIGVITTFDNEGTITLHEGTHMFYYWVHPETLPPEKTIAAATPRTIRAELADEKSGYIYQEATYKLGESVREVMGLEWLDGL